MQFPEGPYYAWHIYADFSHQSELPKELEVHANHFKQMHLIGKEITPKTIELLLEQLFQGMLRDLYISPFAPNDLYNDQYHRELHRQLLYDRYTYGCGAAGYNQEKSIAVFARLDEYILNRHTPIKNDERALCHPVVIFESFEEMAEAIQNMILTGSLDGKRERPPVVSDVRRGIDPSLLCWIENELGEVLKSPGGLDKVVSLMGNYYINGYPVFPDWLAPEPGNWTILGELPNLKVLYMPKLALDNYDFLLHCPNLENVGLSLTNLSDAHVLENLPNATNLSLPAVEFDDFSFLLNCHRLEILDLSQTNFRDCSILTKLPELKMVELPAERQLLHLEKLEPLPVQVKTNPSRVRGEGILSYDVIKPCLVEPWSIAPPYKVLYIDIDDEKTWEGRKITQKVVEKLIEKIKNKKIHELMLSLEYWGEDEYMTLSIFRKGVLLSFTDDQKKLCYILYDPTHPVDWTQVEDEGLGDDPGEYATTDLNLAAECVAYFIKTGKLYPGAYWARYY